MASKPEGLLIVEDYLNRDNIEKILDFADFQIGHMAKVGIITEDASVVDLEKNNAFEAERIELHPITDIVVDICDDVFSNQIANYYDTQIEWYEFPHILRYRRGGQYIPHSDSESWDEVSQTWKKGIDRDYSAIIYLNDKFTGGRLHFPNFDYHVDPRPGMLVCFPSGNLFRHAAEPTESGKRYAFVTWASEKGVLKLSENPPMEVVRI